MLAAGHKSVLLSPHSSRGCRRETMWSQAVLRHGSLKLQHHISSKFKPETSYIYWFPALCLTVMSKIYYDILYYAVLCIHQRLVLLIARYEYLHDRKFILYKITHQIGWQDRLKHLPTDSNRNAVEPMMRYDAPESDSDDSNGSDESSSSARSESDESSSSNRQSDVAVVNNMRSLTLNQVLCMDTGEEGDHSKASENGKNPDRIAHALKRPCCKSRCKKNLTFKMVFTFCLAFWSLSKAGQDSLLLVFMGKCEKITCPICPCFHATMPLGFGACKPITAKNLMTTKHKTVDPMAAVVPVHLQDPQGPNGS